jgi:thioesterase domain-containing protein
VHVFEEASSATLARVPGWVGRLAPAQVRRVPAAPANEEGVGSGTGSPDATFMRCLVNATNVRRPNSEHSYRALVTIQAGRSEVASIVCVPGAGANVTDFFPLASALGDGYAVHGVQPRGMDGHLLPHSTVEAAARLYLRDVSALSGRATMHLVGHSFGGWVAFEMAVRLTEAGCDVGSLTLIDSGPPDCGDRERREYTRPEALHELVLLYEEAAERSLHLTARNFWGREADAQVEILHACLIRAGLLPSRAQPSSLRGPIRAFETALRTSYRPASSFDGPTTLFLVPQHGETEATAENRFIGTVAGWRQHASALRFTKGSGNHITVLKTPNVASVAAHIRELVEGVRRDRGHPHARPYCRGDGRAVAPRPHFDAPNDEERGVS